MILAGEGKHFSAGHDLKALVGQEEADEWVEHARDPRGQVPPREGHVLRPLQADPRLPQADHRRGPGQLRGRRPHAGLHVRPHRGRRRRRVLQPGAADDRGRRSSCWSSRGSWASARPRSSCGPARPSTPRRPGAWAWSTGWCRRAELAARTRELADRVALVPPATAQVVKDSLNHTGRPHGPVRRRGSTTSWPTTGCTTPPPPLEALEVRKTTRLDEGGACRPRPRATCRPSAADVAGDGGPTASAPPARCTGIRVLDVGTRISAPFCAGLLGELGADVIKVELPGGGRLHADHGPVRRRPASDGPGYSLSWAVEGRGRRGVTCDLRTPDGQALFRRLAATRRRGLRELPPRHHGALAPRPRRPRPAPGLRAHQRVRPGRPLLAAARASTAWASPTAGCST